MSDANDTFDVSKIDDLALDNVAIDDKIAIPDEIQTQLAEIEEEPEVDLERDLLELVRQLVRKLADLFRLECGIAFAVDNDLGNDLVAQALVLLRVGIRRKEDAFGLIGRELAEPECLGLAAESHFAFDDCVADEIAQIQH